MRKVALVLVILFAGSLLVMAGCRQASSTAPAPQIQGTQNTTQN